MSRTRSIRCTANTNIIKILNKFNDANRGAHNNPCTFKGVIINVLNPGTNGQGIFSIYDNNIGTGFTVPAAVALAATANTITLSSGTWDDKGLYIGQKIATSGADESANNIASMTITNLTSTVITVDEDLTTDGSDTGLVIDSAGGDNTDVIANIVMNFASDGSGNDACMIHELDGIMCHNGLRIESNSWTNLEVFVLVG
tara:strand:- start:2382 stop:2981 length:600 start_codon:yes stop_codon:yes gene_type:complete